MQVTCASFDPNFASCAHTDYITFSLYVSLVMSVTIRFPMNLMGYHVYRNTWKPAKNDLVTFRLEPENEYDVWAVAGVCNSLTKIYYNLFRQP